MIQIKRVNGDAEWFGIAALPGTRIIYSRRWRITAPGMPCFCKITIIRSGQFPVEITWPWTRLC